MESKKVVVLDPGNSFKAGFSGEDKPSIIIDHQRIGKQKQLQKGKIVNRDNFIEELHEVYKALGDVNSKEHAVAITEPISAVQATRDAMCEIFFEELNVPLLWCGSQPYLSFMSLKKPSGCIIECGAEFTQVCCVQDHKILKQSAQRIPLGGNVLNRHIQDVLEQVHKLSGLSFPEVMEFKEKTAYIAGCSQMFQTFPPSPNAPFKIVSEEFTLGGKSFPLGNERFQFAEPLFQPALADLDLFSSVSELLWNCVSKAEIDQKRVMLDNINLTGGCSLIPGFETRFKHELVPIVEKNIRVAQHAVCVNVYRHPSPTISAWLGAAMVTTAENFFETGLSSAEYMEQGPSAMNTKCFG